MIKITVFGYNEDLDSAEFCLDVQVVPRIGEEIQFPCSVCGEDFARIFPAAFGSDLSSDPWADFTVVAVRHLCEKTGMKIEVRVEEFP